MPHPDSSDSKSPRSRSTSIGAWVSVATERGTVVRACKYAVIVGAILITINHWDALLAGDVDSRRVIKMCLTVMVPYTVSTLSSVGATLSFREQIAAAPPPADIG